MLKANTLIEMRQRVLSKISFFKKLEEAEFSTGALNFMYKMFRSLVTIVDFRYLHVDLYFLNILWMYVYSAQYSTLHNT